MKRLVLIIVLFVGFGIYTNAQEISTDMYNDGILLAFIEQRSSNDLRTDFLLLRNISGQEINVTYRVWQDNFSNNYWVERTNRTQDITIQPGSEQRIGGRSSGSNHDFVAGFAIINISTQSLSTPPAQSFVPERWEYRIINPAAGSGAQAELNKLGAEGWELVSVGTRFIYLKRRLP